MIRKRISLLVFALFALAACIQAPRPQNSAQLVDAARQTILTLKAREDLKEFEPLLKQAWGIAIFPSQFKAGFIVGAEAGNGVVLARNADGSWGYPAFYTLAAGSVGLQAGGQKAAVALILRSPGAVEAVVKHQGKLGADAGLAIGPVGTGVEGSVTTNLSLDVVGFTDAKGAFGGASLEGAAMIRRLDLNKEYYGRDASPQAILLQKIYQNAQANGLRSALLVR